RAELRIQAEARMQRRASESERADERRPALGGGRGSEELLRHDPERSADEASRGESERRTGEGDAASVPEPGGAGRNGGMDTRGGDTARVWNQPTAEQHLPGRAGSEDETAWIRDGTIRRRLRNPVPKRRRGRESAGRGEAMDGEGRPEAAPGEDADR